MLPAPRPDSMPRQLRLPTSSPGPMISRKTHRTLPHQPTPATAFTKSSGTVHGEIEREAGGAAAATTVVAEGSAETDEDAAAVDEAEARPTEALAGRKSHRESPAGRCRPTRGHEWVVSRCSPPAFACIVGIFWHGLGDVPRFRHTPLPDKLPTPRANQARRRHARPFPRPRLLKSITDARNGLVMAWLDSGSDVDVKNWERGPHCLLRALLWYRGWRHQSA